MAHEGLKQRSPFRKSFIPSRRQSLQTGPLYRATGLPPQTRRRFGGRHPLCGIGVTSLIDLISSPVACSARIEDSRPDPGPFTRTSTLRTPCSRAALTQAFAAIYAAKGVPLRDPLKPHRPALDHDSM